MRRLNSPYRLEPEAASVREEVLQPPAGLWVAPSTFDLSEALPRWGVWTAWLVGVLTLSRLLIIATTNVADGEAYYYVWSRFPAWSYYDHPPVVAWMTWATTRFSHADFFMRLGPVLCSALLGILVYRLAERLFTPRAGFIAVLIVSALPVFTITSFVLNPEAPLAPLWVLCLLLLEGMRYHDEPWRPIATGLVVGLVFLAKYTGILLVGVVLMYVVLSPLARRWLRRPSFYLGGLAALVSALPVIVWNYQHDWPSLALHFVEREAPRDMATLLHNALQVAVGQVGPFHPLIFPGLLVALYVALRRSRADDRYRFLALASWPVLLFLYVSMVRVLDPEAHWTMVGYIPVAIAAGGWLDEFVDRAPSIFKWYLGVSVGFSAVALVGVYLFSQTYWLPSFVKPPGPANGDFFTEMVGWDQVKSAVDEAAAKLGTNTVVASSQYALCAHILTTLDDQPNVYCPTLRRTEFDFLGRRQPPPEVPVLYVNDDHYPDDPALLMPRRDCQPLQTVSVERAGRVLQQFHLFACSPQSAAD